MDQSRTHNGTAWDTLLNSMKDIKNQINDLNKRMDAMPADIAAKYVRKQSKTGISGGKGCSIFYNSDGLVVGTQSLYPEDIPQLPISKIVGLSSILDRLKASSTRIQSPDQPKNEYKVAAGTAPKVNWNTEGLITSGSPLLPSDIPEIPIEKVSGLSDILESLRQPSAGSQPVSQQVPAGTYVKLLVDAKGRCSSGMLTVDDLPLPLISDINEIKSQLNRYAVRDDVDVIKTSLATKIDRRECTPGTYYRVVVDVNGLVVSGTSTLDISDLPRLGIENISGLSRAIAEKANQTDVTDLREQLSSIATTVSQAGDVAGIRGILDTKAEASTVTVLQRDVASLTKLVETLNEKIPNDTILSQLRLIEERLSRLEGDIAYINARLGNPLISHI